MKVKCPECKESWDLSINEYDEGDQVSCPECSLDCVIQVKDGKLVAEREELLQHFPSLRLKTLTDAIEKELRSLELYKTIGEEQSSPGLLSYLRK